MHPILLDAAGHRRQPVTLPGYHAGHPPRNKGRRYPADPPTVEEIIAVMRTPGAGLDGMRLRALIVVLWRAGLRIGEALALAETDLDGRRGAVLGRHGKGGKRREVGMDTWAWEQARTLAAAPHPISGRPVVLRDTRPNHRAQLGTGVRAPATGPDCRRSGSQAAVRATSAPPRARDRDGPRTDPAADHPAPTRACPSRGHLDLSPRDRQRGDHRRRPRPTTAGHPGRRRSAHRSAALRPGTETRKGNRERADTTGAGSSSSARHPQSAAPGSHLCPVRRPGRRRERG